MVLGFRAWGFKEFRGQKGLGSLGSLGFRAKG